MAGLLKKGILVAMAAMCFTNAALAATTQVGDISVDQIGNKIKVSALKDPDVSGVTCHFTNFERSAASRVGGLIFSGTNPFENPSNTSISCMQTGPIKLGNISLDPAGQEIFSEKASLIFKYISVKRLYDCESDTLIYVSHSRQIIEGSAKQSISTIPLFSSGQKSASCPKK